MHLPTLSLINNSHVYVEGDVSIDSSAAIAPGVILRAAPDSKIIIGSGVCIGMGSILHAYQGSLEISAGVNLGAGVLVVGNGKIGANACIGAATTIWNSSVEPGQVVPGGSVLGKNGRQVTDLSSAATSPVPVHPPETPDVAPLNGQVPPTKAVSSPSTTDKDSPTEPQAAPNSEAGTSVYGQDNLNRLLKTLFPYDQSLNRPPEDG
ncbi:transferase [Microcoleus sp. FACHB-SPT15]|nr:transferase [Microcoleus sp. FACHB-SPT15]